MVPPVLEIQGVMSFARMISVVAVALAVQTSAPYATAAPSDDAEVFVQRGIAFRKQFNKDREALEEFRRAYQLARTPRIQAQIGAAEQALGRWVDAELHVAEALSATTDIWIVKNRPTLEQALVAIRAHLGTLDIIATPPGAEIRIDGREIGRAPLAEPLRVPAGSIVVELRAPGHHPVTRTVLVAAEQLTRETLTLQASTGTGSARGSAGAPVISTTLPAAGPSLQAPANATPDGNPTPASPSVDDGKRQRGSWRRPLAWTFAAGAIAFAGGGVAALVVSNGKAADYNNLVDSTGCRGPDAATCSDLHSDSDGARTLAIVGFSLAGALAVTATVLFLNESRAREPVSIALRTCGVDWIARGMSCSVSF